MKIDMREEELIALLTLAFVHGKNDFPDKHFQVLRKEWIKKLKNEV